MMKIEEILADLKEFGEEGHTEFGYEMPLSEVIEVIKALEEKVPPCGDIGKEVK